MRRDNASIPTSRSYIEMPRPVRSDGSCRSAEAPVVEPDPLLSIVVPTHDRPRRLADHLESMTRVRYPAERYELIVVDDGGPGSLDGVVAPFRASLPVTLIRQDHRGPGPARNAGVARARGRYLVFTADDCQPAVDWLTALERRLVAHADAMIGGTVDNGAPDDLCATTNHLLIDYLYRCHDRQVWKAPFFTPNNLALPADLFRRIGGFDESIGGTGEDRELCGRWLANGFAMVWATEVVVRHSHPQNVRAFWQQHVAYGRGSRQFYHRQLSRHGGPPPVGWLPEALSFYGNLVRYPLVRSSGYRGSLQAGLMVLSQIANVLGFVLEGVRLRSQTRAVAGRPR
jgi:glycosyltransferase involved in cell wall biosynthesis